MRSDLRMLDQIHIAKPCPANWDEMKGDDQVRHCSQCRLNVYNISEMSAEEALRLVQNAEGRMCVRMYRREDGTVITRDCPKGLAAFRQRVVRRFALAASLVLTSVGCGQIGERLKEDFGVTKYLPSKPPSGGTYLAGAVAMPAKTAPVKTASPPGHGTKK